MQYRTIKTTFALVAVLAWTGCGATAASDGNDAGDAGDTGAATDARDVAGAADVGTDTSTPDVAPDAPLGPIDGSWLVTDIQCNGMPGGPFVRDFITPPNSSSFEVRGAMSTYTLVHGDCVLRLDSVVTYPMPGRAVFTATGPFACNRAACHPACGTTPSIPYVYDYSRHDPTLVMTTVGDTPDRTCTGSGQSNPITYTYMRR